MNMLASKTQMGLTLKSIVPKEILEDDNYDEIFGQTQILSNASPHRPSTIFRVKKKKKQPSQRLHEADQKIYHSTLFLRDSYIPANAQRTRSFVFKPIDRANLFEGLPFVQFDAYVRRDRIMQQIIVRDLLKILADKCNSFKNVIMDKGKMKKIFCLMVPQQRTKTNIKIEESVGLLNSISLIILLDFKDSPESIGLKPSPIKGSGSQDIKIQEEDIVFEKNLEVFNDMVQFFRDCIDAFMIMSRQLEHKTLDEMICFTLLQQVTKLRYLLSEMGEELRIHDRNSDEKVKRIKLLLPQASSEKELKKIFNISDSTVKRDAKILKQQSSQQFFTMGESSQQEKHLERQNKLSVLMANKFNFGKNKFQTRESKIILNQDKIESEKALILESNQDAMKSMVGRVDNRKLLAMERLRDPAKDPEIRAALRIAAQVLNINIEDQL